MARRCLNFILAVILIFFVIAGDDRASKSAVTSFVNAHQDALVQAIEARDFSEFENKGIIKDIRASGRTVEFSCGGVGIGSGTAYVGFYYAPDRNMSTLWCAPSTAALTPEGNGFLWKEPQGDNQYYTEHICGNFYYYEASF